MKTIKMKNKNKKVLLNKTYKIKVIIKIKIK